MLCQAGESKKFWLCVSTHKGEENLCINTHLKLREKFKNLLTIIAPRHIERVNDIKKLCENYHLNTQILDNNKSSIIQATILRENQKLEKLRYVLNQPVSV